MNQSPKQGCLMQTRRRQPLSCCCCCCCLPFPPSLAAASGVRAAQPQPEPRMLLLFPRRLRRITLTTLFDAWHLISSELQRVSEMEEQGREKRGMKQGSAASSARMNAEAGRSCVLRTKRSPSLTSERSRRESHNGWLKVARELPVASGLLGACTENKRAAACLSVRATYSHRALGHVKREPRTRE